ncbi:MAG: GTPase, partial [Candidatus Marsarchaeota archaeon]|nr:GTPase [Candidatus Marsarchaeota archaeon]
MARENVKKSKSIKVIVIGAAGRDFHNFNVLFRNNKEYDVVAFTANQIPYITNRNYPEILAGKSYKKGIHIYDESKLSGLIRKFNVDISVMSYSDLPFNQVMHIASLVNAAGSDFWLVAPNKTMIKSSKPVIAVCAVRTGCGKSQVSRYISKLLREKGFRVVIIRHPMPYGVLKKQAVQKFSELKDLDKYNTTIEEREDYEPHLKNGFVVYAGVDYGKILKKAEKEADIIIWDGGNNDAPFIKPELMITVVDPLRAGNELNYYPGETVAMMADVLLVNKVNSANKADVERVVSNLKGINNEGRIFYADSVVTVDNGSEIKGKRVCVVEDGPTITHGGMLFGAGSVAVKKYGAKSVVEAKKYAVGEIKKTFERYEKLRYELPAVGYSNREISDLQRTINKMPCDVVVSATPTDLKRLINV